MSEFFFDSGEVEAGSFGVLPPGDYECMIEKVNVKVTKNGDGQYLNVQMKILSEWAKGRVVFDIINFENASAAAQRIGRQQLKALVNAVYGEDRKIQSPNQFVDQIVGIRTGVRKDQNGEDKENVRQYIRHTDVKPPRNAAQMKSESDVPF